VRAMRLGGRPATNGVVNSLVAAVTSRGDNEELKTRARPRRALEDKEDHMDAKMLEQLRKTLTDERERLASDLADLEQASQESLSDMSGENNYRDHMADQGTATFTKEFDIALEENVRDLLGQVEKALARIDSGQYGTCASCGKPIGDQRLKAMPAADKCITCKSAEEGR
jgi:DnaK suppressor protein